ncbi:MAG: arylsulfatase [Akkermansiaceae bacterium]
MYRFSFNLAFSLYLALVTLASSEERLPNVVLIFADDLGYGDLGCYGATKLKTPNIDRLAAEGRRFIDAHSSSAVCTPSRYGLLTGEYPYKANGGRGLWGPAPVTSGLLIPPDTLTIADLFKKSGYDTAVFGKWHLGFGTGTNQWKEPLRPGPQDLGFDYYFGMPVVNSAPPYVYVENDRIVGSDPEDPIVYVGRNTKDVTPITPIKPEEAQRSPNAFKGALKAHELFNDYEVGTTLTKKATEWIKSRNQRPFFAYIATTNVHHPFTPAKRFQGTSDCGVYGDFVHELDWIVGEVRNSLEAAGVADNTLIIFTSDNGGMFNLGGRVAAEKGHKINGNLLGSKFGIWEGGHRVPFIAWWPGKIEPGTVSNQMTISVDLLATFAALTHQKLSAAERKDSINMLTALTGNQDQALRKEMYVTPHKPTHMAYRKGKWMFIPAKSDGGFRGSKPGQHAWGGPAVTKLVGTPNSDIENGQFKKDAPLAQLYDLETDPNQTKNLYHKHPEIVAEMAAVLKNARPKKAPIHKRPPGKAATKYDGFKPLGNLRFTFESGKLDDWKIIAGKSGNPVSKHDALPNHKARPFNQEGQFHLSTIDTGEGFDDQQQVILQSPAFVIEGDRASFLASGGFHPKNLYVGLIDAKTGRVLLSAGGARGPQMKRTTWNVSKLKGNTVYLQIVDQNTNGWGHLTFDDFSIKGTLQAKEESGSAETK